MPPLLVFYINFDLNSNDSKFVMLLSGFPAEIIHLQAKLK